MYTTVFSFFRLILPGGFEIRRHINELNQLQWLSKEDLKIWQFKKLKHLLKHAYETVPYYHKRYQDLDIHPNDIKSL